jgi:hypothetical protein
MIDRGVLPEHDIVGVLQDAAGAFLQAPGSDPDDCHITVVALINAMLSSVAARPARQPSERALTCINQDLH